MRRLSNALVALVVGCVASAVLPGTATAAEPGSSVASAAAVDPFLQVWGDNRNGALGDGTTTGRQAPVPVALPDGSSPVLVSGGRDYITAESHTLAASATGVLYAWGRNQYGQLGNGTTTQSTTPVVVTLPSGVTPRAITAGGSHNLMIGSDGRLYAWGNNANGQLGNGTTTSASTPVVIALPGGARPVAVAAGYRHSLALGDDGVLYAWGYNNTGELGIGTTTQRTSPVAVPLPAGVSVTAMAAGLANSAILTSAGTVYGWGDNQFGQLGDGTTTTRTSPGAALTIPGSPRLEAVAIGYGHVLVETRAGEVYSAGFNNFGQLGVGSTANSSSFAKVTLPAGLAAQKILAASTASFVVTSDGKVYGWGDNRFGQLSDGTTTATSSPKLLTRTTRTVDLSAGAYHLLEIASSDLTAPLVADGAPLISGVARQGGLLTAVPGSYNAQPDAFDFVWRADGGVVGANAPVYRPSAADVDTTVTVTVTAKKSGYADAVTTSTGTGAVVAGGRVTAWGSNFGTESTVPASLARKSVTAIAAGFNHTLALTSDLAVTAWGNGIQGTVPAAVAAADVTAIAAGTNHNLALTSAGHVLAWGNNAGGQSTVPPELDARTVIAIAAGNSHSLALTSDGQVVGWGSNSQGQTSIPAALSGRSVVAIAAGSNHSLALTSDGQVVAWGGNGDGQATVPAALNSQTVVAIAAGTTHSLALTSAGQVVAWGGNAQGQTTVPASLSGRTVVAIASGAGADHSLALTADRQVVAWGSNGSNQRVVPASLTGQPTTALAVGGAHSVALTAAVIADRAPSIEGTPRVGATLTADLGGYNVDADVQVQWYADDVAVPGATDADYSPTPAQLGQTITVTATAARAGYLTATDTSSGVGPVATGTFTTGPDAAITGSPVVGGTLTASPSDASSTTPTADSFTYAWSADGEPIPGATASTLDLAPGTVGRTITVTVTAHRSGYADAADTSDATAAVAEATFTTGPDAAITGDAVFGATLTAAPGPSQTGATSPAADSFSYQWFADGSAVDGATDATLAVTSAMIGTAITVAVTAHREGYADVTDESAATDEVAAARFATGPEALITGTAVVDGTLTAAPSDLATTSPAAESFTYRWFADGAPVAGATARTLDLTPALVGATITVTVTAVREGYDDAADTSAPVGPITRATFSSGPAATVSGQPVVGATLSAAPTGLDSTTPRAGSFTYAWAADGQPVPGANASTLALTSAEAGRTITVTVTATRAGYIDAPSTSAPTAPVSGAAFVTGPSATISGTVQVGQTLTAGTGVAVPAPEAYRFVWSADGNAIPGATGPTLQLTPDLRGRRISVTITAVRTGYVDATSTSVATNPVATDRAPALQLRITAPPSALGSGPTPDGQPTVRKGATVTLRWEASDAESLTARGELAELLVARYGDGAIPLSGTLRVRLDRAGAHTYRLLATNEAGTTAAASTIVAVRPPTRLTVETPAATRPGRTIRIRVTGLGYRERYYVTIDGQRVQAGRAGGPGTVVRRITIPTTVDRQAGEIRIRVTGRSTRRTGTATVRLR